MDMAVAGQMVAKVEVRIFRTRSCYMWQRKRLRVCHQRAVQAMQALLPPWFQRSC